jgi:hypothetical protein
MKRSNIPQPLREAAVNSTTKISGCRNLSDAKTCVAGFLKLLEETENELPF